MKLYSSGSQSLFLNHSLEIWGCSGHFAKHNEKPPHPRSTSLPPLGLVLVFLEPGYFLLRAAPLWLTALCITSFVICYVNNTTKKKRTTWSKAREAVTFQLYSRLWKQPNKGRARSRQLTSYIPERRHRAEDVLSRTETQRRPTNESVLGTLWLSVHILIATHNPEWRVMERWIDLISRLRMRTGS